MTVTRKWVGEVALAKLLEDMPAFAGLALWLRHVERPGLETLAATDGINVFYGPGFAKLSLKEQMTVMAHEVLHAALQHPLRGARFHKWSTTPVDHSLLNIAADALVNEALSALRWVSFPDGGVRLAALMKTAQANFLRSGRMPAEGGIFEKPASHWSMESLYLFLADSRSPAGKPFQQGGLDLMFAENPDQAETGVGGNDAADRGPAEGVNERRTQEWNKRLSRLAIGRKGADILRALQGDLPRSTTPWDVLMRRLVMHALQPNNEPTWLRPSRRGLLEPGLRKTKPAPRLAVCVDTSGSIDESILRRFGAEMRAIAGQTGAEMTVIVCDAAVTEVHKPRQGADPLIGVKMRGGGGTDFRPAFARAAQDKPDALVFLTDLMGTFPERPVSWPVFWAVPVASNTDPTAPFGRVIPILEG